VDRVVVVVGACAAARDAARPAAAAAAAAAAPAVGAALGRRRRVGVAGQQRLEVPGGRDMRFVVLSGCSVGVVMFTHTHTERAGRRGNARAIATTHLNWSSALTSIIPV